MADCLDDVAKSRGIEYAARAAIQIKLRQFDRKNIFALCHAVSRKTVLTGKKRHTIGQELPLLKPCRSTDDDNGIPAAIQHGSRYDNHGMRARVFKVGRVDRPRLDHASSSIRPTALRRPMA